MARIMTQQRNDIGSGSIFKRRSPERVRNDATAVKLISPKRGPVRVLISRPPLGVIIPFNDSRGRRTQRRVEYQLNSIATCRTVERRHRSVRV